MTANIDIETKTFVNNNVGKIISFSGGIDPNGKTLSIYYDNYQEDYYYNNMSYDKDAKMWYFTCDFSFVLFKDKNKNKVEQFMKAKEFNL